MKVTENKNLMKRSACSSPLSTNSGLFCSSLNLEWIKSPQVDTSFFGPVSSVEQRRLHYGCKQRRHKPGKEEISRPIIFLITQTIEKIAFLSSLIPNFYQIKSAKSTIYLL